MKKRILSLIIAAVMVFGLCLPAVAAEVQTTAITYRAIKIVLNEEEITPCDEAGRTVEPFIMNSNGTTYLPLRAIAQALGLSVSWDGATSTVTLTSGGEVKTGAGAPGKTVASVDVNITYRDIKVVLDGSQLNLVNRDGKKVEPFILNANSSVYLPLRVLGEALGLSVNWDGSTSTASLGGVTGQKAVQEVRLSATDVRGEVGNYFRLEAYVSPDDAVNKTITWTSTNTKVVGINSDGLAIMRAPGTADIVATSINGKTARCHVTVRGDEANDPFDEELGYSAGEIEMLIDYGSQAEESVAAGLEACTKAQDAGTMAALHVNTAVSHAYKAAVATESAYVFLKNSTPIKLEDEEYSNALDMLSVALGELETASQLEADNDNAQAVLKQVRSHLAKAADILERYVKAMDKIEIEEPEDESKPEGESKPEEGTKPDGTVVVDKDGVKITLKGLVKDEDLGVYLKLLIENNSGKDLTFQCRDASANGFMVDTTMSVDVLNGKKANDKLIFDKASLAENDISEIEEAEFVFHIFDMKNVTETYLETEIIKISESAK